MEQIGRRTATTRPPGLLAVIRALIRNDSRLFGRDSFLLALLLITVGLAVLLRLGLPWLGDLVSANPDFWITAEELALVLVGYIVIYESAVLGGVMVAFILLDERDDRTMEALLVTPMRTSHYLGYRLLIAIVIAFVMIVANMYIVGQALVAFWQLLLIAAVAAMMGGLSELFLATFAGNKAEGFAMLKIMGTIGLVLFAAWFVPMPWELLIGVYPPYWAVKAYWLAEAGDPYWWLALLMGVGLMSAALAWLVRRFNRVVRS